MALVINGNSYISLLRVQATYDLSGTVPVITLNNLSQGGNLSGVNYAFVAIAPDGTFIHNGNILSPDKSGIWTTDTLSGTFPQPNYQIEWGLYSFQVIAIDGDGNVFTCPVQLTEVIRPYGNNNQSQDTYGVGSSYYKLNCLNGNIFFRDTTSFSYAGLTPVQNTSVLKVIYPIDPTGNIPSPFQISSYVSAVVPITYSSKNYQYYQYSIYTYDCLNDTFVTIRYTFTDTFPVYCNVSLEPLICEINKLTDSLIYGRCEDAVKTNLLLNAIMGKFSLCMIGLIQPETNIDVPELIEEIKKLGGFTCDCCSSNTGIIPSGSSVIDGYNFLVNKLGGDATASWTISGNNITLNYGDVTYLVTVDSATATIFPSISFVPSSTGSYQKTYSLHINPTDFANEILTTIQNSPDLTNLLITIINEGGGIVPSITVDGKCIIYTSSSCNYSFTLHGFTSDSVIGNINNITVNNVPTTLNYNFTRITTSSLLTYLNGLGIGAFTATVSGTDIIISSTGNGYNLSDLLYSFPSLGTTTYIADSTKTCSGYVAKTMTEIAQSIIDYICGIDDSKIVTSQDYTICSYISSTNTVVEQVISAGADVSVLLNSITAAQCNNANEFINLKPLNCSNLQSLFPANLLNLSLSDVLYGSKSGTCSPITLHDLMIAILKNIAYDSVAMADFCNLVANCGAGKVCTPYTLFSAITVPYNETCPTLLDFTYTKSTSQIYIESTQFGNDASGTISVQARYKLSTSPIWGSYSSPESLVFATGDGVGILSTVISFTGLSSGTYDVEVYNICAGEIIANTVIKQITI